MWVWTRPRWRRFSQVVVVVNLYLFPLVKTELLFNFNNSQVAEKNITCWNGLFHCSYYHFSFNRPSFHLWLQWSSYSLWSRCLLERSPFSCCYLERWRTTRTVFTWNRCNMLLTSLRTIQDLLIQNAESKVDWRVTRLRENLHILIRLMTVIITELQLLNSVFKFLSLSAPNVFI